MIGFHRLRDDLMENGLTVISADQEFGICEQQLYRQCCACDGSRHRDEDPKLYKDAQRTLLKPRENKKIEGKDKGICTTYVRLSAGLSPAGIKLLHTAL